MRARVARLVGQGDEVTTGQIPFTPQATKLLELALREALTLADSEIGTEHIPLGVMRETDSGAARILHDSRSGSTVSGLRLGDLREVAGLLTDVGRHDKVARLRAPGGYCSPRSAILSAGSASVVPGWLGVDAACPEVGCGSAEGFGAALGFEVGDADDAHAVCGSAAMVFEVSIGARAEVDRVSAILRHGDCDPPLARGVAHLDVEALVRCSPLSRRIRPARGECIAVGCGSPRGWDGPRHGNGVGLEASSCASTTTGDGFDPGRPSASGVAPPAGGLSSFADAMASSGLIITLSFLGGPWDGEQLASLKPPIRRFTVDGGTYRLTGYTASGRPGDAPEAVSYTWKSTA